MIYLTIFLYLLILAFLYDICEYRKHKNFHFILTLCTLILVSGLRYRLGSDTVSYMIKFDSHPDIFHLDQRFFETSSYDPLWIIMNSVCKTISKEFFLVQLVVSSIHVGIWGYFVKSVAPKVCFGMLLFYFLFEYVYNNMEVMRQSLAYSFFLLSLLYFNKNKYGKVVLCILIAFLFHRFSIVIVLAFCVYYYLILSRPYLGVVLFMTIALLAIVNKNWIFDAIGRYVFISNSDEMVKILKYASSTRHGESTYNWKGVAAIFGTAAIYILLLRSARIRYSYDILLKKRVFESAIYLGSLCLVMKFFWVILFRFYDYFQTFTSLLVLVYCYGQITRMRTFAGKLLIYSIFILGPAYFSIKKMVSFSALNTNYHIYHNYYPYYSVLNPLKDDTREKGMYVYKVLGE